MAVIKNYSQSKVKTFRRCQKQYSFRHDYAAMFGGTRTQEMVPKAKRLPLYRGSWMHALQSALHYQWAGVPEFSIPFGKNVYDVSSWEELQADLAKEFEELFDEEKEDLGDLDTECERLFRSYLRFWKADRERYKVVVVNKKPVIERIISVDLPGVRNSRFKGTIDLLVEDLEYGGYWVWDAKWVKVIPAPDERMMSPQALMYVWALRKKGLDIRGFVFNYGRTKAPVIPYTLMRNSSRGPAGSITRRQKLDTDYYTYLKTIKEVHGDEWKLWIDFYREKLENLKGREQLWFRRERIPVEEDRIERGLEEFYTTIKDIQTRVKPAPRSYFYNCKFSCDYHDLCCAEFQGLDVAPLVKANYEFEGERYGKEDLLDA